VKLQLERITLDQDIQPREEIDHDVVSEYADDYKAGVAFPPVSVFHDGTTYWLSDGYHRYYGAREAGISAIEALVTKGGKREAMLQSVGCNATHGVRRTNDDKRRAVLRLLKDKEWARWSDREIAKRCAVSNHFVADVRRNVTGNSPGDNSARLFTTRQGLEALMPVRPDAGPRVIVLDPQRPDSMQSAAAVAPIADRSKSPAYSVEAWQKLSVDERSAALATADAGESQFNRTNENIEWALWSWNPVTGCLHNCDYCYARDIANRFYAQKFVPTFLPARLQAPRKMKVPAAAKDNIGEKNVFTCSMADLFGKWVPQDWIDAVFSEVRAAPAWNFLFLTKFPKRLSEMDWPKNAWCGTTVDTQHRVEMAEKSFSNVKAGVKWLSCEPLLQRLTFSSLEMFDWIVIGGQSRSTQTPEFQPKWEWVEHLIDQARKAKCKVYIKPNLTSRPREYPGQKA
jgi:protein gp37